MDTFKICHFRFVTGANQRVEACLHQLADTAAKDCLFAEQVCFGLFLEGRFQNARSACTDTACISQRVILRLAGSVLIYRDQTRYTLTLYILTSDGVSRSLRRDHDNIKVFGRNNLIEMNVEAMRKC